MKYLQRSQGFSLLELSIVLIVIGLIIASISLGGDLFRHANNKRIFAVHIAAWKRAYDDYLNASGGVPPASPANAIPYIINGGQPLCDNALVTALLNRGIKIPLGNGVNSETRLTYSDSNGSPHELSVCFFTHRFWSDYGNSAGTFRHTTRQVMRITGLSWDLATELDVQADGKASARFGSFRSDLSASQLNTNDVAWPVVRNSSLEQNIGEINAFLAMD